MKTETPHTRLKGANHEIKELRMQLEATRTALKIAQTEFSEQESRAAKAEKALAAAREQFGDIKRRLHEAEMLNAELRGYLSRVQEDDVVQEPLVQTGDPEGHQTLVPKRKPTHFPPASSVEREASSSSRFDEMRRFGVGYDPKKPKHWIEY